MTKKAAIVLCGCGSRDGSEVHESVLTLLSVVKNGVEPLFFAPVSPQARVVNHLTGQVEEGERSMIVEAARIARGKIKDIKELKSTSADCLLFPGGNGSSYNIFNYAEKGINCQVNPDVERVINDFYQAGKPIGFICIAPVMGAKVLGKYGIEVTIGNDKSAADAISTFGAKHIESKTNGIHVDRKNKIVSTPAYMLAQNIGEIEVGIAKLVETVIGMA